MMNSTLRILSLALCLALGFASGWLLMEHKHPKQTQVKAATARSSTDEIPGLNCGHASNDEWYTVHVFNYPPSKSLYYAEWQFCPGEPTEQRVRITDANFQKVFFHYDNDEVLRLEMLDLVGDHVPQLLVLTIANGTGDYIDWHVISESKGALTEWKLPNYDSPSEKVLGADEDFGYKDWNFHMQGNEILLARGIYKKGEGNCCPSRGGVLVRLRPTQNAFEIVSVARLSEPEYYRWRDQKFCMNCSLY